MLKYYNIYRLSICGIKMCTETTKLLVAERVVYCRRLIKKFTGNINIVYLGMSNRFNVRNINALCPRVSLFYNITSCNTVFYYNAYAEI